jgi:uncharacterized protein
LIKNQAQTILYQPREWANYVAYMLLFGEDFNDENNLQRFVQLSPLIHIDSSTPRHLVALLEELYKLDMDLTEDKDMAKLHECFTCGKGATSLTSPSNSKSKITSIWWFLEATAHLLKDWRTGVNPVTG